MSDDTKIKTVTRMYEAFGRGDVATILDALADDVDWAAETTSAAGPWYGARHGKDAVTEFFTAFGSAMEIEEFTPLSYAANDDDVLSVVRCRARSRATGKPVTMDLHHWFRFRDGKIYYYRGTEDTAQVAAALRD
ncbi:MAG TPA: nuclear transport factor 2 family protein [Streptosporangiaceae bacterium]|nr:nuclear transport factor 2 family protein [Streptosporangiaceae bacterium]